MRKKLFYLLLIALFGFIGILYFYSGSRSEGPQGYCAFCDFNVLTAQKFYEDDYVVALYTHKPVLPGHCLIVPKRHTDRFEKLSDEEFSHIVRVIKKVNLAVMKVFDTSSYLILQKNGFEAGQTVPHVHFHYIPRKAKDSSFLKFFWRMYIANIQKPIKAEKMQEIVGKMKEMME